MSNKQEEQALLERIIDDGNEILELMRKDMLHNLQHPQKLPLLDRVVFGVAIALGAVCATGLGLILIAVIHDVVVFLLH